MPLACAHGNPTPCTWFSPSFPILAARGFHTGLSSIFRPSTGYWKDENGCCSFTFWASIRSVLEDRLDAIWHQFLTDGQGRREDESGSTFIEKVLPFLKHPTLGQTISGMGYYGSMIERGLVRTIGRRGTKVVNVSAPVSGEREKGNPRSKGRTGSAPSESSGLPSVVVPGDSFPSPSGQVLSCSYSFQDLTILYQLNKRRISRSIGSLWVPLTEIGSLRPALKWISYLYSAAWRGKKK